jgi:acyl dehydratase
VTLYWEDFEAGQEVDLGERVLAREEIVGFAQEWDPQDFHLDEEAARSGPFGGLVASGWQTICVWTRMYVDGVLGRSASMGGPGIEEIRFLKPVRPGERLRGQLRIAETRPSSKRAERGTIFFEGELLDDGDEPVLRMVGRAFVERRTPG